MKSPLGLQVPHFSRLEENHLDLILADEEIREILRNHISYWEDISVGNIPYSGERYVEPCCKAFYGEMFTKACGCCPIANKTGWRYCLGSPAEELHLNASDSQIIQIAYKHIDWLKTLLEDSNE